MNKLSNVVLGLSSAFLVFGSAAGAKAASVTGTGSGNAAPVACVATGNGAGFHINEQATDIAVYFHILGDKDCTPTPVTLVTWSTPNITGQPLSEQVLFDHSTGEFGYKSTWQYLTAKLPSCTYQVDLVAGSSYLGTDGTDNYGKDKLAGMLGGHVCTTTPAPTTPAPTNPAPVAPTTPTTPAATPTALPNTGPGSVIAIFAGTSLIGGLAYRFVLSRRFHISFLSK